MKNTMWKFLGIGLAAAIAISPVAQAQMGQQGMGSQGMGSQGMSQPQQQGMGQQGTGTQGTQGTAQTPPATQPPASAEEEAAYKKVSSSVDAKQVVTDATDFLKKFPSSRYASLVYAQLAMAYLQQGEGDKAGSAAQKSIQLNPNGPDAYPVIAMVSSHQIPDGPGAAQKIKATEDYANQGIQLLNALQKPPEVCDLDFTTKRNEKLAMCHSALGLAYLHEGKGGMAVQHLLEATKLEAPPDAMDMYLLAVAYDATGQFGPAASSFEAACPKFQGDMQQRCNDLLKEERKKAPKQ
jgi:Tfp pilus assembly protein PilF